MVKIENGDTRYFVEIDLTSLKLVRCAFDQKENLNKGRQDDPKLHRLFLTKGQYHKFVDRCGDNLADIIES
ncbi:hypothetical protein R50073_28070 [Maricurvus nonylphenolicus]